MVSNTVVDVLGAGNSLYLYLSCTCFFVFVTWKLVSHTNVDVPGAVTKDRSVDNINSLDHDLGAWGDALGNTHCVVYEVIIGIERISMEIYLYQSQGQSKEIGLSLCGIFRLHLCNRLPFQIFNQLT